MMTLRVWATLAGAVATMDVAAATDQERYVEFAKTQVFDQNFPNSFAHRMIAEGIASSDPAIIDLTIYAMAGLAEGRIFQIEGQAVGILAATYRLPDRALSEVPGLRDFLIRHFEEAYDDWDRQMPPRPSLPENMDELSESDQDAALFNQRISRPAWMGVPDVLSLNWRGDQAVHDFLLGGRLLANVRTVQLLNQGGFATPEANALRLEVLAQLSDADAAIRGSVEWSTNQGLRYLVARGLALSQAPEAVPHLLDAAAASFGNIPTVLRLLDTYESEQLVPFQAELKDLLTSELNDVKGAYPRLEGVARFPTE